MADTAPELVIARAQRASGETDVEALSEACGGDFERLHHASIEAGLTRSAGNFGMFNPCPLCGWEFE